MSEVLVHNLIGYTLSLLYIYFKLKRRTYSIVLCDVCYRYDFGCTFSVSYDFLAKLVKAPTITCVFVCARNSFSDKEDICC